PLRYYSRRTPRQEQSHRRQPHLSRRPSQRKKNNRLATDLNRPLTCAELGRRTSNLQPPTPNTQWLRGPAQFIGCWMFDVGCSMVGVRCWMFFAATCLLGLSGCATAPSESLTRFEFTQPQMGLPFRIVLYAPDQTS